MDQHIEEYLEKLVNECLQLPQFAGLPNEQKNEVADKIRDRLYQSVLDLVVDRLNSEQLSQLEAINPDSPEMAEKIREFTAEIPNMARDLDQKLKEAVENIKQNPSVITSPNPTQLS